MNWSTRYVLAVALMVWAAAGPGVRETGRVAQAATPGLVIICVDTLRADHLGLYGYERDTSPEVDAWFGEGLVFERAYCTAVTTTPSVVSLLSGQRPQNHGVRLHFQTLPETTGTLGQWLSDAGYQTAAFVSNMVLTREATALDREFDYYDDHVSQRWPDRDTFERTAADTTDAVVQWLDLDRQPGQPFFLYVHYMDPHGPYLAPEDKPKSFDHPIPQPIDLERLLKYLVVFDSDDGLDYVDGYDEEIAYADREIGRLLRHLETLEQWENLTVVFTSDHGESMMEHEKWFRHGYHVYEEIARVPLAVRGPGFTKGRVATPVSLTDVAPTLLGIAGVTVTEPMDGRPLSAAPEPRYVFVEAKDNQTLMRRALISGNHKWVIEIEKAEGFWAGVRGALFGGDSIVTVDRYCYDLKADPDELHRLEFLEGPEADALWDSLTSDPDPAGIPAHYEKGMRITAPKVAPGVSEENLRRLRGLGYVQ